MQKLPITTEGVYQKGLVVPRIKPRGRRRAIITFLPFVSPEAAVSDEEIWNSIRKDYEKIQEETLKETYPMLWREWSKKPKER